MARKKPPRRAPVSAIGDADGDSTQRRLRLGDLRVVSVTRWSKKYSETDWSLLTLLAKQTRCDINPLGDGFVSEDSG